MSYARSKIRGAKCLAAAALLAIPTLAPAGEANDEDFKVTAQASLPGGAQIKSFDISYVDPTIHTYVLGDRTNKSVDVVDTVSLSVKMLTANPPFAGVGASNVASG